MEADLQALILSTLERLEGKVDDVRLEVAGIQGEKRGALGVARWAFPSLAGVTAILSAFALYFSTAAAPFSR